jgi:hypothetical protein
MVGRIEGALQGLAETILKTVTPSSKPPDQLTKVLKKGIDLQSLLERITPSRQLLETPVKLSKEKNLLQDVPRGARLYYFPSALLSKPVGEARATLQSRSTASTSSKITTALPTTKTPHAVASQADTSATQAPVKLPAFPSTVSTATSTTAAAPAPLRRVPRANQNANPTMPTGTSTSTTLANVTAPSMDTNITNDDSGADRDDENRAIAVEGEDDSDKSISDDDENSEDEIENGNGVVKLSDYEALREKNKR